jgi:alkylation response protein AidB-like acyl-CoA dehydrogenase
MYIALSDDQESFGHECRRLLEKEWSSALAREVAVPGGCGHSPRLHKLLADAGWLEMATTPDDAEEAGTLFDLGIAVREAGRALVPTTLHSCVFAGLLLRRCTNSPLAAELSRRLGRGTCLATAGYLEPGDPVPAPAHGYGTFAIERNGRWILTGVKDYVLNAATADELLVAARVGEAPVTSTGDPALGLFLVHPHLNGVRQTLHQTFGHDSQSRVTFTDVELDATALLRGPCSPGEWSRFFRPAVDEATALLCMEMLGGTERVLEDTVAYVSQRVAFGRPIGTFQAVQHMLADVRISASAARVASLNALWAVTSRDDARREVSVAKSWLSRAYKDTTLVAHQLYGGAGYVREADLHLWSQRAKAAEPLFGGRGYHLRRLASLDLAADRVPAQA